MSYDREDFYNFWDNELNSSYRRKDIEAGLDNNDKNSFDSRFEMYQWVMKFQKEKYEEYTYEDMDNDQQISLSEKQKNILRNDTDIHLDL